VLPIQEELTLLMDEFIELDRASDNSAMMATLSSKLMDNAHLFSKADIYETMVEARALTCTTEAETARVGRVDALIRGFIQSERKARARLKVNYILAGAASDRIDDAMAMLAEADEIDNDLFLCIDNFIQKELTNRLGPTASPEDDMRNLSGIGKSTIEVLKMVQRRLRAEVQMENRPEVRLLATLIGENNPEERDSILRKNLHKVEEIESFAAFVDEATEHLTNPRTSSSEESGAKDFIDAVSGKLNVEMVKDIRVSLREYMQILETGLKDGDIFSAATNGDEQK
jgi:hypothetical protein